MPGISVSKICVPFGGGGIDWSSYCTEATALFARMTSEPDAARKAAINTLIVGLKDANIWGKLDILYVFIAHDKQAALLNWVRDAHNATEVGTLTFTASDSIGNSSGTNYLRSHYNIANDAINYANNSASAGIWCKTDQTISDKFDYGAYDHRTGYDQRMGCSLYSYGTPIIHPNTNTSQRPSAGNSGIFLTWSLDSGTCRAFKDGVFDKQFSVTPTGLPDEEIYIGASSYRNNSFPNLPSGALYPSTRFYRAFYAGAAMTDEQQVAIRTLLNFFFNTINEIEESIIYDTYLMAGQSNMQGLGEPGYNVEPYSLVTGNRQMFVWTVNQWQGLSPLQNDLGIS